jgi:hypothetical protein
MDDGIIQRMRSFREWFSGFKDHYVIIGGAACSLIMGEEEIEFRQTKDIDVVLLVEALDAGFGKRLWAYIIEAGYAHRQKSTGKSQFYRFYKPKSATYPEMIELFSRRIDGLTLPDDAVITPVPMGEDISSLSAILLNDEYYGFLRNGVRRIDGTPVLDEVHMIPFKAKAWLELTRRKEVSGGVDANDIRKHRRDVYRMVDLITDGFKFTLPKAVEQDMCDFMKAMRELLPNMPLKERRMDQMRIEKIATFFGLPVSA